MDEYLTVTVLQEKRPVWHNYYSFPLFTMSLTLLLNQGYLQATGETTWATCQ